MMVWQNGEWKKEDEAQVSIRDGSYLRGEGLFETMLGLGGEVFALEWHWERLLKGARRFGFEVCDYPQAELITSELLARNGLTDMTQRIRVRATLSASGLVVIAEPASVFTKTEKVILGPFIRNEQSLLSGMKTTSYGDNTLALRWAREQGFGEVLFANTKGEWCEGSWSNLFIVENGELITPPLKSGCLPGITRKIVIKLAKEEGLEVCEEARKLDSLHGAEEVFLTSSLRGVQTVKQLNDRELQEGLVTRRIHELLTCTESKDSSCRGRVSFSE